MDLEELNLYQQQLVQVNQALVSCSGGPEKEELLTLKASIEELLELTNGNAENSNNSNIDEGKLDDEFAAFMSEMEKEGAVEKKRNFEVESVDHNVEIDLKDIEGKKCKAPHQHQWGHIAYHNAMICSVASSKGEELKVKVLFTNPTHQEMLPCPFYYNADCKFSEEQCRFSHGEVVLYSSLQDYLEPNFELLTSGSSVLAKQKNNLWYRAKIKQMYDDKCIVKFESDCKELEVQLEHVFPLEADGYESSEVDDVDSLEDVSNQEDIINKSLMVTPSTDVMGDWEKYTKGMGSKLMQKMGYIVGTGLGKNAEGRVNPVSAVIFPVGKSLDHCMNLREQSGGDKDLFSVERKMKRLQRKQEMQSKKAYERQQKQQDVFSFINKTVQATTEIKKNKCEAREDIKNETSRSLNIKSVTIEEDIRKAERDLDQLRTSLARQVNNPTSDVYKRLNEKLCQKQGELARYREQAQTIKNEQSLRDNKKKLTVF